MSYNQFHYESNNPVYTRSSAPKYQEINYVDVIEDDGGDEFRCEIVAHYYRYDDLNRIVFYSFQPKETFYMTEISMDESVRDSITQALGYNAMFECNGKMLEIKPYKSIC